jgi:hypothetical protein
MCYGSRKLKVKIEASYPPIGLRGKFVKDGTKSSAAVTAR